jgi:hypothetical protein
MRRFALVSACVLVACGDSHSPVWPSVNSAASRAASLTAVTQSASGSPIRWTAGEPFILTFVANKYADGRVSGRFHADAKSLNARLDVNVTCLSVEDNRAWIGGIIEKSDNPLVQVGLASYFYVIDIGEGAIGAIQQDIVSALRLNDTPGSELTFCAGRPTTLPFRRIEDGNVQVRD